MDPSVYSKSRHKLTNLIEEHINKKVPAVSICESWLKPHITNAQINIPGYQIIRQDRINRARGGVLLYIHNSLPTSNTCTYDDDYCAAVLCEIKSKNLIIASVYRPPDTKPDSFANMLKFLQTNINKLSKNSQPEILIMGDFNLPAMSWQTVDVPERRTTNASESLLTQFNDENFLSQCIDQPTRQKNILDLLLTNNANMVLQTDVSETPLSDHNLIKVKTTYNIKTSTVNTKPQIPPHSFRSLNLQKTDFSEMDAYLNNIDWDELKSLCTPEEFPELLRLTVLQVCELFAPSKSEQSNKPNQFVRDRNILRRRKRKIKPQIQGLVAKNPSSSKLQKLRAELYDIDEKIKTSMNNQRKSQEEKAIKAMKENPRFFYSYAKRFSKIKSSVGPLINKDGNLTDDPKSMADLLQEQYASVFSDPNSSQKKSPTINCNVTEILESITVTQEDIVKAIDEISETSACGEEDIPALILKKCKNALSYPILQIWRQSLNSGLVPQIYKSQIITPAHKKASKAVAENYRPISLTSHIIKIIERVIKKQIVEYLVNNNRITKNQHGFQKHRSCQTQLIPHVNTILLNFLMDIDTDMIYLDYAKAFDKVDHQLLLKKLYAYGIRGKLLMWINSYLSNRSQVVVINGVQSKPAKVVSGVPQGTVLGPVLFLLYLNDLECSIKHSLVSSFADDTRLKKSISEAKDTNLLQEDLNCAIKWSEEANMLLHQKKFELLTHSTDTSKLLKELPFYNELSEYKTKDGSLISPSNAVRDLGITLTPDLSWSHHISNIVDDARKMAAWTLSVFISRSADIMIPLFKTAVRSKLEYCCPVWNPTKLEDIKNLEAIQRSYTAKITEVQHLSYYDRLKSLKLMSLQRRRERYVLIQFYKILHELAPNDIDLVFYPTTRRGVCCKIPPLIKRSKTKYQRQFDDSFHVYGARLWNVIPNSVKEKNSVESFKIALTKLCMQLPDNPPIPGIASQNSLIDVLAYRAADSDIATDGGLEASDEDTEEDTHRMA